MLRNLAPVAVAICLTTCLCACGGDGPGRGDVGTSESGPDGSPASSEEPAATSRGGPSSGPFVDVAEEAGIDIVTHGGGAEKDHILESVGCGAAFLDYDADGHLDLYVVNAWILDEEPTGVQVRGRNRLYRGSREGVFSDVTEAAGVGDDGWGCGVCVGDYDDDGHVDIYVTNFGPNVLYRNRGDGTFEEVAAGAGVDEPGWGAGASFFDGDGDGDLDLYVANYIECTEEDVLGAERSSVWRRTANVMVGPFGLQGGRDRYLRNLGDGTFEDATDAAGLTDDGEAYGLGVIASDLDHDGDVDLYVANDSNQNYLYRNEGDGRFTDIGGWCGAGFSESGAAQAGMGVDAGDFDGDGLEDLFVTNFSRDYCTLYHHQGDLFFEDVTSQHEIREGTYHRLSWGCAFFDADLDADLDLVVVNGHIFPQVDEFPELEESYEQRLNLFRNDAGSFVETTDDGGEGFQVPVSGRGLAVGDYDEDGDLDLLVTAMDRRPLLLQNRMETDGHWLALRLLGPKGSPALNARATLYSCGKTQLREVRSGSTYQSQNSTDLHFGLGACTRIDSLRIHWPDGTSTLETEMGVDLRVTIRR